MPRGKKPKSVGWTQRPPWGRMPDGGVPFTTSEYPHGLTWGTALVGQEAFLSILRRGFGISATEADLNLLEYHGLLVPFRKICVEEFVGEYEEGHPFAGEDKLEIEWRYSCRQISKKRRNSSKPQLLTFEQAFASRDFHVATCPVLLCSELSYKPVLLKPPDGDSLIYNKRETQSVASYPIQWFNSKKRWHRPSDLEYWKLLGRTKTGYLDFPPPAKGAKPQSRSASRKDTGLREVAYFFAGGNDCVERLYWVGVDKCSRRRLTHIDDLWVGQDHVAAALLDKLDEYTSRHLLLELIQHTQKKSRYGAKGLLKLLEGRLTGFPKISPEFYREVLASSAYYNFTRSGKSVRETHECIRKFLGRSLSYTKRIISSGTAHLNEYTDQ